MRFLVIIFVCVMQGCSSAINVRPTGSLFEAHQEIPKNMSLAYFFQPDQNGVLSCLLVGVDRENYKCMGYPGYIMLEIDPGHHEISFMPDSLIKLVAQKFEFQFEPNQVYYFEFKILRNDEELEDAVVFEYFNVGWNERYGWVLVEEQEAQHKMEYLRLWE